MSPTDSSFRFDSHSSIEGRFASPSSSTQTTSHSVQRSPWTDRSHSAQGSRSSASSGQLSSSWSASGVSPRPPSFNWDQYEDSNNDDDDEDEDGDRDERDELDSEEDDDEGDVLEVGFHEDSIIQGKTPYYQFTGHPAVVRRRLSSHGGRADEQVYDSVRHGVGSNISDVSQELAKARSKMLRTTRAMKSMEQELQVLQASIDESKASSASTRSAMEENFWRLECLARTIEKDRQDSSKQLQALGRESSEALEAVTNWEVRIDWLQEHVDNTSEYVSELVLSEQECMSFIKMIIQQNQRYAMPAISRATERNIRMMATPRRMEIAHPAHPPTVAPQVHLRPHPLPQPSPQPLAQSSSHMQPQPSVRHIPISWLLDPIMPPKPPEISTTQAEQDAKRGAIEPPAEMWRDFSRLTMAFENGQTRTPYSPFQRTRSRSTGQGALVPSQMIANTSSSLFKTAGTRRPQLENLTPLPKVLPPAVPASKLPGIKRRNQNLNHLPVHSWLQFQFYKTMTTPGALGQSGKKTNVLGFKPVTIFQTTV
ncbi:hypothetical protein BGX34_000529 [Mortierella sp. NVP85]|nr:hypothetical protein BGX34_000529 [Mortierella sp. NVP85]